MRMIHLSRYRLYPLPIILSRVFYRRSSRVSVFDLALVSHSLTLSHSHSHFFSPFFALSFSLARSLSQYIFASDQVFTILTNIHRAGISFGTFAEKARVSFAEKLLARVHSGRKSKISLTWVNDTRQETSSFFSRDAAVEPGRDDSRRIETREADPNRNHAAGTISINTRGGSGPTIGADGAGCEGDGGGPPPPSLASSLLERLAVTKILDLSDRTGAFYSADK